MFRRIYRQRRRLLLGFPLFAAVGYLTMPLAGPLTALWPLILPAGLTVVFAALIAVRPRLGVLVEILAATLLLQQGLFALSPFLEQAFAEARPLIRLALPVVIYALIFSLGTSFNQIEWPGTLTLRAARLIHRRRATVWQALAPGRAHWDPAVGGVETVMECPAARRADGDANWQCALTTPLPRSDDGAVTAIGESIVLSEHERGTMIDLSRTYHGAGLLTAAGLWLADHPGAALDNLARTLTPSPFARAQAGRAAAGRPA